MGTIRDMVEKEADARPELSFDRSDIERRFMLPAGRFTTPGPLLAPLGAFALMVAFYGALAFTPEAYISVMFTQRSAVPYVIVFLTAWSLMLLIVKNSKLRLQRRALALRALPEDDPGFILTPASAEQVLRRIHQRVEDAQQFLLTRRITNALSNLQNMGRIGDVDEVLSTQADSDEGQVESGYTILLGFIWAIPVLGFIGTVWGLSIALGRFGGVLANAEQIGDLRASLQGVTGGLSTAFETTLQGLVAALSIHMLMIMTRSREERFLDECREYCQRFIVGRLRLENVTEAGDGRPQGS